MCKSAFLFVVAMTCLAMAAFPAWAQTGVNFSGVVTDQTGAALNDVTVTIKNLDTGETRTILTDVGGHYQESGLPPGRFVIRAAKPGFDHETRTGISLAVGQEATVDIKMQGAPPTLARAATSLPPPIAR